MSVENSRDFILALIAHDSFLGSILFTSFENFNKYLLESEQWNKYRTIAGGVTADIARSLVMSMVHIRLPVISITTQETLYPSFSSLSLDLEKNTRQMIEIVCKNAIFQRKKIQNVVKEFYDKIINWTLTSKERENVIRFLLTGYKKEEMEKLKQTAPLLLHIISYNIEKLIRVYGKFEEKDEYLLIEKLITFKRVLGIEESYDRIFHYSCLMRSKKANDNNNNTNKILNTRLPNVLANIILSYTNLSVLDNEDEDEILRRICS